MASWKSRVVLLSVVTCCLSLGSCRTDAEQAQAAEPPKDEGKMEVTIEKASYGQLEDGTEVDIYTLTNANGMRVKLTNFGALTVSVEAPDSDGNLTDVTLGYDTLQGWVKNPSYLGATVGRYANRIAKGKFTLDGETYTLATNNSGNHLHGGKKGFNKVLWDAETVEAGDSAGVKFTYLSPDGEEGYPGNLNVTALHSLTNDNEFKIEFTATTDKPTVLNLTQHSYWNLSGAAAGDILDHEVMLNADQYTVPGPGLIPTGEIASVRGTPLDFTTPTAIGARIDQVEGGYDHNYVLRSQDGTVALAARAVDPKSGRVMEVYTDQPGVQLYTGNFLDGSITGKGGVAYKKHYGFCLETQKYPDSPNHKSFPSAVLRPGETYKHTVIYKFPTT